MACGTSWSGCASHLRVRGIERWSSWIHAVRVRYTLPEYGGLVLM